MFDEIKKRLTAGALAVCSLASGIPTAGADNEGISLLAEDENQPSSVILNVNDDCGPMWDASPRELTFSGDPTIWTANFKLSDGTIVHCYCASNGKGSPNGAEYYIAEKVDDWKLASLANISDARNTLAAFLNSEVNKDGLLTEVNFPQRAYFAASQIAVWTALGQVSIVAGSGEGFSWTDSTDLKTQTGEQAYPADALRITFRADGGTTTEDQLVLYAAVKMLEYAALNGSYWESLGHAPWVGGAFTYGADYKDSGYLNLPTSIAKSGKFTEEEYARLSGPNAGTSKKYWVFHMAASSATFVMNEQISLNAKNLPEGAFLKTTNIEDGSPRVYESLDLNGDGVQTLGLHSATKHDEYYENSNQAAWGQEFDLYIPQDKASGINAESPIELTADMNVARYGAYIAKPKYASGIQNMLVVEPGVVHQTINWMLTAEEPEEHTTLKIIKKDADDTTKSLQGAKFKIEYMADGEKTPQTKTTGEDGTVTFPDLPLGAEVTITEIEAPDGYELMSPNPVIKTLSTTPGETGIVEYTLTDKRTIGDTVGLKIIKKDADNATKSLQGAKFKIEYTKEDGAKGEKTGTTDANGTVSFSGLPLGYKKDPNDKNHLIIDEDTAWIVRKIFEMAKNGNGSYRIRRILEEEEIPCPTWWNRQKGLHSRVTRFEREDPERGRFVWDFTSIQDMLENPVYIGAVAAQKRNYRFKTGWVGDKKREDWIVVEGMHEPIIDRDTFDQVQEKIKSRKRADAKGNFSLFAGLIKCGQCGSAMTVRRAKKKSHECSSLNFYTCSRYNQYGVSHCSQHRIQYDTLYNIVLEQIRLCARKALADEQEIAAQLQENCQTDEQTECSLIQRSIDEDSERIATLERIISRVYEDMITQRISEDNFSRILKDSQEEQSTLKNRIALNQKRLIQQTQEKEDSSRWLEIIKNYADIQELDSVTLNQLIQKIVVHEDIDGDTVRQTVEIYFYFNDKAKARKIIQKK